MKTKFKKGDEVILIDSDGMAADRGALALVTRRYKDSSEVEFIDIIWNRNKNNKSKGQHDGGYFPKCFKLANLEWDDEDNEQV